MGIVGGSWKGMGFIVDNWGELDKIVDNSVDKMGISWKNVGIIGRDCG